MNKKQKPVAWGCKTCNKFDWAGIKKQLAAPEHISYRGVDIGSCNGEMIPLYSSPIAKKGEKYDKPSN